MKKVVIFIAIITVCTNAYAGRLLGVDYVGLTVEGKTYEVPMYRESFRQQFYMIKKAVEYNDLVARELILAGNSDKQIFIGDNDTVRWLIINSDGKDKVIERK